MNADERNRRYRALLEGTNAGLLVEIGRETFGVVMRRIEDLPGIKLSFPEVGDIADLSGVRTLLVYQKVQIGEEEVPLAGIPRKLRDVMRSRPDSLMFRKRCQHLPRLFQVLVEHRNLQQHHVNERPTTSDVVALCGVVLSILDICTLGSDRTGKLAEECRDLVRAVTLDEEHGERDLAPRVAEQEQAAGGGDTSEIESLEARLEHSLRTAVEQIKASVVSSTERLEAVIGTRESDRALLAELFAEWDEEAEAEWDARADEIRRELELADEIYSGKERPWMSSSMAEDRLKDLRDKIRQEMGVEHWENICMMNPIVGAAVRRAHLGEIATLEDWRNLPAVRQRYAERGEIMERQLERYGEEMMSIYRRVERSS